jgi:predicted alpha/beta superfamily hydrolase
VLLEEREFTARLTNGKVGKTSRLMVVVGGRDRDDEPDVAEAFAKRMELLSGFGLRTRFRRYDEEGHMSVPVRAVPDTLRFVFEPR